jgi:hypothetical protein
MALTFTDKQIQRGLKDICAHVLLARGAKMARALEANKKQGVEREFETQFEKSTKLYAEGWTVDRQVNRSKFKAHRPLRDGWVDTLLSYTEENGDGARVAIEFKVCELPRLKANSPNDATYDVGQLAWDFGELARYEVEFSYCIALIHGWAPSMPGVTPNMIARAFHNALFVDFRTAEMFGKPKTRERVYDLNHTKKTLPKMKLDKPYFRENANPHNFCIVNKKHKLAVVGLHVNKQVVA